MAAKRGHASAQYNLGNYYNEGSQGVLTQSSERAFEWYTLSANQGFALAQYNVGVYYCNGNVVEQSYTKARKWLTKAAAQGQEDATNALKQLDNLGV